MSWWNAKYTNGDGDNEITFGSKYYEKRCNEWNLLLKALECSL